ncbi:MAG: metallophosphoesterase family protein [Chitinophagales bacterium]|nr:metallophosphoesterase family protein [Chitinophagales bacterium]
MRICLLSDTHAHLDPRIIPHLSDVDEIWHAGDIGNLRVSNALAQIKPFRAVYGNIDGQEIRQIYPEDLWWECEGFSIWMTHIGGYPTKFSSRVRNILKTKVPDIFICGHSHILRVMRDAQYGNMVVMNPGAAGNEGFHRMKTLLKFDLVDKKILNMQAIELGRRGEIEKK